jgi:hypothetical protein
MMKIAQANHHRRALERRVLSITKVPQNVANTHTLN